MIPTVGDIYCAYSSQLGQYTACQVTELRSLMAKARKLWLRLCSWIGQAMRHFNMTSWISSSR